MASTIVEEVSVGSQITALTACHEGREKPAQPENTELIPLRFRKIRMLVHEGAES